MLASSDASTLAFVADVLKDATSLPCWCATQGNGRAVLLHGDD